MRYGWQGPCETTVTACAAGTHSIGNAARLIAYGPLRRRAHRQRRGGHDPDRHPGLRQHDRPVDAAASPGPFDVRRDGFVIAEGAGVLVLEELGHRRSPAAPRSSAEVLGGGQHRRRPPHHRPRPRRSRRRSRAWSWPSPTPASRPADVVHINAHGTSTPLNDAAEAEAIAKVFGHARARRSPRPRASPATRSGAAGALEAVAVRASRCRSG